VKSISIGIKRTLKTLKENLEVLVKIYQLPVISYAGEILSYKMSEQNWKRLERWAGLEINGTQAHNQYY